MAKTATKPDFLHFSAEVTFLLTTTMANVTASAIPISLPQFDTEMLSLDAIPQELQVPFAVAVSWRRNWARSLVR